MDDDALELGTEFTTWAIKDFSANLRQQITREARLADCTVAEWLHGYFQKFGIAGRQVHPVKITAVEPVAANGSGSIEDLCKLTEAAAKLAEYREKMPKALAGALSRRLREAVRQPEASPPRPKLLAAPEA
jgi:hypothetical protein